ncbi:MAG: PQQ-binding-like beta-propeller repeat protein [bacterium]|nr:PQQ-binding-like beta-propeller repeat protein [bacterium]
MKKNKLITIFLLVFVFSSFVLADDDERSSKKYKNNDINFEIDEFWSNVQSDKRNKYVFKHKEDIATINITIFSFSEPVTVNAFQKKIMSSHYDGWMNLFERQGSEYEIKKANVEDSCVAVYCKTLLNERLEVEKDLVGEYYYLKGSRGYLLSVITAQELWTEIEDSFKTLVNSFWVGNGERPEIVVEKKKGYEWEMDGQNAANNKNIKANPDFAKKLNELWKVDIQGSQNDHKAVKGTKPVIVNGNIYFIVDDHIYSYSINEGKQNWSYKVGEVNRSLCLKEDVLYFIRHGKVPVLYALMYQNGNVIYKKTLSGPEYSHPVVDNGKLFIIDGKKILALDSETGREIWHKQYDLDHQKRPVVNNEYVVLSEQGDTVIVCDVNSGETIWRKRMDSKIMFPPLIYNDNVIVSVEKNHNAPVDIINTYDIKNGYKKWGIAVEEDVEGLACDISVGKGSVYAVFSVESRAYNTDEGRKDIVMAFDMKQGSLLWERPIGYTEAVPMKGIMVADQLVFVYGSNDNHYYPLDAVTGEPFSVLLQNSKIEDKNETEIITVRLYKSNLIKMESRENVVSVTCLN